MAISVNWETQVIYVPQSYLTLISAGLYELDVDQFRLDLKALEESEEGIVYPDTHQHFTEITIAGVTYARFVEIINGYTVEFEDGLYSVLLSGANNNIFDVANGILVLNQVSIISQNSAGLISVPTTGTSAADIWSYSNRTLTSEGDSAIAEAVWAALTELNKDSDSFGELLGDVLTVKKFLALQE